MTEPIIHAAILSNSVRHHLRRLDLELTLDNLFGTFDNPAHNCRPRIVVQVIRIILDVILPGDLRIEGNHDQPSPDTVIISPHLRQMVRVKYRSM